MTNEDDNSGWFSCLMLVAPYIIIGALMFLYYAIRNHVI